MDNVQQTEVVNEEKPSVGEEKPKVTPAPKAPAAVSNKPTAAKAGVGTSAGARTKTIESAPSHDVYFMRRRITWIGIGAFLFTCFLMFLRFFLPAVFLSLLILPDRSMLGF